MTNEDKLLLLKQATKLYELGIIVDSERHKLKRLVECGVSYDAPELLATLERCEKLGSEWNRLEAKHLALRKKLGIT